MVKKIFLTLVFSVTSVVWSSSSIAASCSGSAMSDGHTGGEYPQQYELSAYESAAGCTMSFS